MRPGQSESIDQNLGNDSQSVVEDPSIPLPDRRMKEYCKWLNEPKLAQLIINTITSCNFRWTAAIKKLQSQDPVVFGSLSVNTVRSWFVMDESEPDEKKRWKLTARHAKRLELSSQVRHFSHSGTPFDICSD